MEFEQKDGLCWHSSKLLTGVPHGMFSRHGGVSNAPYTDLNLSFGVGDQPEAVAANRQRIKQLFGMTYLVSAVQVHGDRVILTENINQDIEYSGGDALVTSQRGVGLLIQQADCQAVLLHDPVHQVIGAVHNGWKGSVLNILAATVRTMQEQFKTEPAELRAVVSPSLGPCCAEFVNWRQELPVSMHGQQVRANYFDFWAVSKQQLLEVGLHAKHIDIAGKCTACDHKFFSYRRAKKMQDGIGRTGRCGSVIMLDTSR